MKKILKKIKNKLNNTQTISNREIIYILILFVLFGTIIGGIISYKQIASEKEIRDFLKTYKDISKNYYEEIDTKALLQSGLVGMMDYLKDPYSEIILNEDSEALKEMLEGEYVGIGAEIQYIYSTKEYKFGNIYKDSPSEKAGIKTGDILKKVNGKSTENMLLDELTTLVKGKEGTSVTITVEREKKELDIELTRDKIDLVSVGSKIIDEKNKIGYIRVSTIAKNTYTQFKENLEKLEKEEMKSLIIDLRENNGGYLDVITKIINLFAKPNEIIYNIKTKGVIKEVKDNTDESRNYKIVVLVNENTASAAEVFTSYLKEDYKATIIGTRTFGKGKVQKIYQLTNGDIVKYTTEEWLTPSKNNIDKIGIEPNIEIQYEYKDNVDNQIKEAIKELTK